MDPVEDARRLVQHRFPTASVALLTGSAARGQLKATSDLDIVLVVPDLARAFRETTESNGRLVELFVQTPDSLLDFVTREIATRCSPLLHMCAHSVQLLPTKDNAAVQAWAKQLYAAGPAPLSEEEMRSRRYMLSASLDDLADAVDPDEQACIAGDVFLGAADLLVAGRGVWLGRGKWLARQLREADPVRGEHLLDAYRRTVGFGQSQPLLAAARQVLDDAGGWLQQGYRQEAPAPGEKVAAPVAVPSPFSAGGEAGSGNSDSY